jgi:hypothetical protein
MGHANYYKHGDYNVICDICGFKYKASDCRMQWDNLLACRECYEERNPQDFVKGIRDYQKVSIPRPDVEPRFITETVTPDDL